MLRENIQDIVVDLTFSVGETIVHVCTAEFTAEALKLPERRFY